MPYDAVFYNVIHHLSSQLLQLHGQKYYTQQVAYISACNDYKEGQIHMNCQNEQIQSCLDFKALLSAAWLLVVHV